MPSTPDEDYDVIVHFFPQRGSHGAGRPTWTIWIGGEKQGERESLKAAITLARAVAAVYQKPAWLLDDTGYPLTPFEPRIH